MEKEDRMTEYKEVNTTHNESGQAGRETTFKATQLIWLLLGILETVLALRFVFKLIGVNAANAFATFLYKLTDFFVAPFASLTGAPASGGMVFEFSTLLAMIVYALVGWGFVRLVHVLFYKPRGTVSTRQTIVAEQAPDLSVSESQTTTTTTEDKRIS
jgi:uncharacterized protein YggT (Ycf19 family)